MIRNYVKQYEAWADLDPDDIDEIELGTRKPSEKVLNQLFDDIYHNNLQGVKDYINLDYDVNAKNKYGDYAIIIACKKKDPSISIIEFLLKNGANPDLRDRDHKTALYYALKYGEVEVVKLLLKEGADANSDKYLIKCISLHSYLKKLEFIKLLLKSNANVNERDSQGNTALHYAVSASDMAIIKLLLDNKANVNQRNYNGEYPINFTDDPVIESLLKKYGAYDDYDIEDDYEDEEYDDYDDEDDYEDEE